MHPERHYDATQESMQKNFIHVRENPMNFPDLEFGE